MKSFGEKRIRFKLSHSSNLDSFENAFLSFSFKYGMYEKIGEFVVAIFFGKDILREKLYQFEEKMEQCFFELYSIDLSINFGLLR